MQTTRYPSPFVPTDRFEFSNQHGSCVLEAVTAPQPVKSIHLKDAPPECLITWDQLEQIALITDQVRLQPACGGNLKTKSCAFIHHSEPSMAGWVKVISLNYTTKTRAKDQIESDMRRGRNSHLV